MRACPPSTSIAEGHSAFQPVYGKEKTNGNFNITVSSRFEERTLSEPG